METLNPQTPPQLLGESSFFDKIFNSVLLKMAVIFFLVLILLIPLSLIHDLISERKQRENEVTAEISAKWGKEQVISGPILAVPYDHMREVSEQDANGKARIVQYLSEEWAFLVPMKTDIITKVFPENLKRGIYQSVVYNSSISIKGSFGGYNLESIPVDEDKIRWKDSKLVFGIQDVKGLSEAPILQWGNKEMSVGTNEQTVKLFGRNLSAPVALTGSKDAKGDFQIKLNLRGSKSLNYFPLADQTNIVVEGDWSSPSFNGGYLPEDRDVQEKSFKANWSIPSFNRKSANQWVGLPEPLYVFNGIALNETSYRPDDAVVATSSKITKADDEDMVQVNFLPEINNYQKTTRVAKYGILVIVLTFASLFFTEIIKKQRVHIIQYILIGMAMVLFYSLLLAISEHLGFNWAYLSAGVATILLIATFIYTITKDRKTATLFGGILTLFYTFIFVLLQLRDYSLIVGTIGVFVILAVLMRVSTKINWYQFDKR